MTRLRQKPLRKIVEDLTKEIRNGFKKVNEYLDNLKNELYKFKDEQINLIMNNVK